MKGNLMTVYSINQLTGVDGNPKILIELLKVLPRNVGVPSDEIGEEVEAYCEDQTKPVSEATAKWIRAHKPYFVNQLDIIALDQRDE